VLKSESLAYYMNNRAWPADEQGAVMSVPATGVD